MVKPGWIIGLVMLFVVLQVIAGICEMAAPLSASAITRLDVILNPSWTDITGYAGNIWSMFWFDYPFFTGTWQLARYIFFIPVSVGVSLILVLTIGQLIVTAFSGILRGIRP